MSFDEIDIEETSELQEAPEVQETSELLTDDVQFEMDTPDASIEDVTIENGDSETIDSAIDEISLETAEPAIAEASFEQTEALVEDSGLEVSTDENQFLSEDEVVLSTEILPDSAPAQNEVALESSAAEMELKAPTEATFDEAPIAEVNPLLEGTQDLEDLDIAEFDQDLSASNEDVMDLENPVRTTVPEIDPMAEMDPMSEAVSSPENTPDLSEMDFGDIEIADLSESPEPSPETEDMMQAADVEVIEEAPITSQAELGNVEEADIENLSEMQEQVLLNE
jgi:hypothetical protein